MAASKPQGSRWIRIWLLPFSILAGAAAAIGAITYFIDSRSAPNVHILDLVTHLNPASAVETLTNAMQVAAGLLAIAVTVVAIVVELAANRYTHRITELFVSEPINFAVMGLFVVTAMQCLMVALTYDDTQSGYVPTVGVIVAFAMLALSMLMLLPYFAFVFNFLNPIQIVDRIRKHTIEGITRPGGDIARKQAEAVRGVEQLADVALNAMEHKDKGVSMASVDALRALVEGYQQERGSLQREWFRVEGDLAHNPDFVSMSPEVLEEVTDRRIWLELKVFRQYQTVYAEALNRMRDINYLIAINTRLIAEQALRSGHRELFDLVVKFFNTYLRATINAKDVRTAYNVLNQYRLLAEHSLLVDGGAPAVEVARYFKYYGRISFDAKLPFILETVAYDLCALNEDAFDQQSTAARELLRIFLDVDKESETEIQEASLRGVRKAQVKLATYYLVKGNEELAREVWRDMSAERPERLASIRDELLDVQTREFWEISDRGVNFDYLPPERKKAMLDFFGWFGDILPPRASILARSVSGEMKAHRVESGSSGHPPEPEPAAGQDPATKNAE